MPSIRRNITANFFGRIWVSVISIIFVPVYIHFIGIEAYGLLGIFTTIQTVLNLLDMGLSTTLNREIAKHTALNEDKQYINNLVFTMERIYHIIAILTGIGLILASWFFATHWVNTDKLDTRTVILAFMLIGVNFAALFPGSLYQGGLMGLQKQVTLNVILSSIATIKAIGAILILWLVSPTIIAFLIWQVILNLLQFFLLRKYLWKHLPLSPLRARFDRSAIRNSGRYAAGIMGISILTILLTQSDKIILSNMIKLNEFGYYALAATVSGALAMVLFPITGAVFPKITELINKKDTAAFLKLFHVSSQLTSFLIIPLGVGLFIFSNEIVLAWTRNPAIASHAGPLLKYLIVGTTINSFMTIPYQYTLAVGWLRFGINISLVAIVFFLPAIFIGAYKYGALGGAFMWMVINAAYFIFAMLYLFSKHLTAERIKWYFTDILRPLLVCLIAAMPFYLVHRDVALRNIYSLLLFVACLVVCYGATLWLGTPGLRPEVMRFIKMSKSKILGLQNRKARTIFF